MFTLGADNTSEMYSELEFSLWHQAMPMAMQQAIQSEMYSLREEKEVGQNVFVAAPSISPPGLEQGGLSDGQVECGGQWGQSNHLCCLKLFGFSSIANWCAPTPTTRATTWDT